MKTLLGLTPWALMIRILMTMKHSKICCDIFTDRIWCGICGFFFPLPLVLSLSSCQLFKVKTLLFEWKHCRISWKWWFFHPIPISEQKRVSFDESERTRGNINHKFRAVDKSQSNYLDSASGYHKVDSI